MVGDIGENTAQPGLGIDVVEFGCLDQGVGDGGGFAAALRTGEQPIFTADGDAPHAALGGVVVDLQEAVIEIGPKPLDAGQGVADRLSQGRLAGDAAELVRQPHL